MHFRGRNIKGKGFVETVGFEPGGKSDGWSEWWWWHM